MAEVGCLKDVKCQNLEVVNVMNTKERLIYIATSEDYDFQETITGDTTILVNVALADGKRIRLPEATTSNGGMKITVVFGISPADNAKVGFVTTKIVGGATSFSDNAVGLMTTNNSFTASDGSNQLHVVIDANGSSNDGSGAPGTVLEFWYTGVANVVLYRGNLIGSVDSATLVNHWSTATVIA